MQNPWLIFTYKVPSEPTRKRAYVWRHLKQMGAVYLQQAICVLPNRPQLEASLRKLAEKITEFEGESTLLKASGPDEEWERKLVAEFAAAREAEYLEILDNLDHFDSEIARESSLEKFTFAELEDLESDLEKIQRWHDRVQARDYFDCAMGPQVRDRLRRAQELMETFAQQVYRREGVAQEGGQ